jgi:hypothetical protein
VKLPAASEPSERAEPLLERASRGEAAAMAALSVRPKHQRPASESLALALGRRASASASIRQLERRLQRSPALAESPAVLAALRQHAADPATAPEALRVIASMPSPKSADLLFSIWTESPDRTETTQLAEQLVYSPEVSGRASPALRIALDLRRTTSCEDTRALLERARQEADRRSLNPLGKLLRRRGCGAQGRHDCYRCLREGHALPNAILAARRRKPPSW